MTVQHGQVTDIGHPHLTCWFTRCYGTVFLDYNENGEQDPANQA